MTVLPFPEQASSGAFIDRRELQRRIGMSARWISYQINDCRDPMPCIRVSSRTVRFRWSDVEAWMQRRSA